MKRTLNIKKTSWSCNLNRKTKSVFGIWIEQLFLIKNWNPAGLENRVIRKPGSVPFIVPESVQLLSCWRESSGNSSIPHMDFFSFSYPRFLFRTNNWKHISWLRGPWSTGDLWHQICKIIPVEAGDNFMRKQHVVTSNTFTWSKCVFIQDLHIKPESAVYDELNENWKSFWKVYVPFMPSRLSNGRGRAFPWMDSKLKPHWTWIHCILKGCYLATPWLRADPSFQNLPRPPWSFATPEWLDQLQHRLPQAWDGRRFRIRWN